MTGLNETFIKTKKSTLLDISNVAPRSDKAVIFLDITAANCCVKIPSGIQTATFPI